MAKKTIEEQVIAINAILRSERATYYASGKTYAIKDELKANGWKYNASTSEWYISGVTASSSKVRKFFKADGVFIFNEKGRQLN